MRDELGKRRIAMAQFRIGLGTMSDSRAALLDKLDVRIVNINAVRKERFSVQNAVVFQMCNRRDSWSIPVDPALFETICELSSTFQQKEFLGLRLGGVDHQRKLFIDGQTRNHL